MHDHPFETAQRTSSELLKVVEADLDARYLQTALPHQNLTMATWYLLTVFEDGMRATFAACGESDLGAVVMSLDRSKYSVRFGLDRLRAECPDRSEVALPTREIPRTYEQAALLMFAGVEFMSANQLCSAAHSGSATFRETGSAIHVELDPLWNDPRYSTLEVLGHVPSEFLDHSARLLRWMKMPDERPAIVDAIAQSAQVVKSQVRYAYRREFAIALASEMQQQPELIPEGWRFPWGGRYETSLLINALAVRCLYHLVAVHFGATSRGMRGAGLASVLLVMTKQQLIADIAEMSSRSLTVIRRFVDYLTYGNRTLRPDPALQTFVGLGRDRVAIPCLMILSSNAERSLLGLQARLDTKEFNALSGLFEASMVKALVDQLLPKWPQLRANVHVRLDGKAEEIDLQIVDENSRTVLVCELRWMLQPGESHEVQQRKKTCHEKVRQLRRKVDWLRDRKASLLKRELGKEVPDVDAWAVHGVVVIQTYGGTLSPDPELPIMTSELFVTGLQNTSSLAVFAAWSQSLCWLPQLEWHFEITEESDPLPTVGKDLVRPMFSVCCGRAAYLHHVADTLRRFDLQAYTTRAHAAP